MDKVLYGTHYVMGDEPCLLLTEQNFVAPDYKGWRRYQVVFVMRNGEPAEYRADMGPAEMFDSDQFRIPGGAIDSGTGRVYIEHTVNELRDIADWLRGRPPFDKWELAKMEKPERAEVW